MSDGAERSREDSYVPHAGHNPPPHLSELLYRLPGVGWCHRELVEQTEVDHRVTKALGHIAYYRATAPRA